MSRAMSATRARDGTIARAVTASRASETATRRRSTRRRRARSTRPTTTRGVSGGGRRTRDSVLRTRASARKSAPHPLSACAVAERASGRVVAEASHEGQGATRAEISCANDLAARGVCVWRRAAGGRCT